MLQDQQGTLDCFPTCFKNALHYFSIHTPTSVEERLSVFSGGTLDSNPEDELNSDTKRWDRSLDKFGREWRNASKHKIAPKLIPLNPEEQWALDLLELRINIDFRLNPISQEAIVFKELSNGHPIICDVVIRSNTGSKRKHAVLITDINDEYLLLHDPLLGNNKCFIDDYCICDYQGTAANLKVRRDYFFDEKNCGFLKPCIRIKTYSFLILSKR